jgi:hypothetical protein
MCKIWAIKHNNKLPKYDDVILYYNRNVAIGDFISGLKRGYHKNLKPKIEEIFDCKIEKLKNKWIDVCNEWIKIHGFKLPVYRDKIIYKNETYSIGMFIYDLKFGRNENLKPEIEKIFDCKIENIQYDWIEICKEWIKVHGTKLPKSRDEIIYKDNKYKIGYFIRNLKYGNNKLLKNTIESLFNQEIKARSRQYKSLKKLMND